MKYKIVRFQNTSLFLDSKKELFEFFDKLPHRVRYHYTYGKLNIKNTYFTDNFIIGNSGNFEISRKTVTKRNIYTDYLYECEEVKYVNALYIIYEEHTRKVDLDVLFSEYYQSRGILKKPHKVRSHRKGLDRSTNAWRKWCKNYFDMEYKDNSFKKEYQDNISAKEEGVKIRTSRAKDVENYHVFYYEDSLRHRKTQRNWKSQNKFRKQWMKNANKKEQ